jgi:hypothetical protein
MWSTTARNGQSLTAEPLVFAFISTNNDPTGSWKMKALPANPPAGLSTHVRDPSRPGILFDYPQVGDVEKGIKCNMCTLNRHLKTHFGWNDELRRRADDTPQRQIARVYDRLSRDKTMGSLDNAEQ